MDRIPTTKTTSLAVALLLWLATPSTAAETEAFGTGEVNAAALMIGDHVEISYRGRTAQGRASFEEAVGTVVHVSDDLFEVETATDILELYYETIIRLDRTREVFWSLDPNDILLSETEFLAKYLESNELTGLEGTWVWDDRAFEIVIVKDESGRIKRFDYIGLILSSTLPDWKMGEIKLLLKQTATDGAYSAVVVTGKKDKFNTTVSIEEDRLIDGMFPQEPEGRRLERHQILRTYPIPVPIPDEPEDILEPSLSRQGSGFFITRNIIATANHLVEDADTIVVKLNGLPLNVVVKGRDKRNDIALLSIDSNSRDALRGLTVVPLILGDSGQTSEGDRIVTSGVPSPNAARPSVSEGIVNSLFGPDEDLTRFTISTTVRENEIGGPLIDSSNRVIGIVLPPDSTTTGPISLAVKADLLATLLRMTSIRTTPPDFT
jgi:S1-C subfamily serine protease